MISAKQRETLDLLERDPQCLLKQLAAELGLAVSGAQKRVDELRLRGLVRKPMGTRRFVLTEAGRAELSEN